MRRLLLNIIAVLSLLLFIAVAALGVRSYWVSYSWSNASSKHRDEPVLNMWTEGGSLVLQHTTPIKRPPPSGQATMPPHIKALIQQVEAQARLRAATQPIGPQPRGWRRYIQSRPVDRSAAMTDRLRQWADSDPGTVRNWNFLGFHWFISEGGATPLARTGPNSFSQTRTPPRWRVAIPLLSVAAVFAVPPLARTRSVLRTRRWERRRREGRCPACGYDLRASSDRCPECGSVPSPAQGETVRTE